MARDSRRGREYNRPVADKLYVWKAVFTAEWSAHSSPSKTEEWYVVAITFDAAVGKLRRAMQDQGEVVRWEIYSLERLGPLMAR